MINEKVCFDRFLPSRFEFFLSTILGEADLLDFFGVLGSCFGFGVIFDLIFSGFSILVFFGSSSGSESIGSPRIARSICLIALLRPFLGAFFRFGPFSPS